MSEGKAWKKIHRKKQLKDGYFDGRFIEKKDTLKKAKKPKHKNNIKNHFDIED